ncbi:DNA repair and recombination protein RadB [Candidatus Woesearchaeota archaeon]|nr:DNA repair and recombination protein RadB [Candidatus Woesearchaeota archaeon]
MEKVSTGTKVLDELLCGGYEPGIVTTVYGPASSGKTNICLLAALSVAKSRKVIFIDTEGGISRERLQQLSRGDKALADNILFLKPTTFKEQMEIFNRLKDLVNEKIGIVIVDTVSMLYRAELGNGKDVYEVNKTLGKQLSYLVEIARKRCIPVLISDQVYSNFDQREEFKLVGGDIINYTSKCLIELKKNPDGSRIAILKKHRSLPQKQIAFRITNRGIEKIKTGLLGLL